LKSTGLETGIGLWETVRMKFTHGDIVVAQGHGNSTFKVLSLSTDGKIAKIQPFNISRQALMASPLEDIPVSTLVRYTEDASQAAARIVRKATED
jgi:hypothetical protein